MRIHERVPSEQAQAFKIAVARHLGLDLSRIVNLNVEVSGDKAWVTWTGRAGLDADVITTLLIQQHLVDGRPLGQESGGDRGYWDRLGSDEGGLPVHLPMGVTERGQGPENDSAAHHWVCWCGDTECPLTLALGHAHQAGRRSVDRAIIWRQGRESAIQDYDPAEHGFRTRPNPYEVKP